MNDIDIFLDKLPEQLTPEQLEGFRVAASGKNCFVTGGAGTGKSVLISVINKYFQMIGKNVLLCAPTGIAATHIGGTTIHRAFDMDTTVAITPKTGKIRVRVSKVVEMSDVLIVDEISMCRMDVFDSMYASLEKVQKKTGKKIQIIVVGDFCQLPPIFSKKCHEREVLEQYYGIKIENPYAFLANAWKKCNFIPVVLNTVKRQNDLEFIENLNKARMCDVGCITYFNTHQNKERIENAVTLYSLKKDVVKENNRFLAQDNDMIYEFPTIFDSSLTQNDISDIPEMMYLKKDIRVIITANDNGGQNSEDPFQYIERLPEEKMPLYYNGSTGIIEELAQYPDNPESDYIVIKLDCGKLVMFYRMKYPIYYYDVNENAFSRRILGYYKQFPLHIAHAITVHRSQGKTYDVVNIDPNCPYHNSGQLYVALSRAKSISGIHLLSDIQPENLYLDACVKDFYANLGKNEPTLNENEIIETKCTDEIIEQNYPQEQIIETKLSVEKNNCLDSKKSSNKLGRPTRFPEGSRAIRTPNEIANSIQNVIEVLYPKSSVGSTDICGIEQLNILLNDFIEKRRCK